MKNLKRLNSGFICLLIFISFGITLACTITGGYFERSYRPEIGGVSPKRYKAPYAVVNEAETKRLQDLAAASVEPVYKRDLALTSRILSRLESFFTEINRRRTEYMPILNPESDVVTGEIIVDSSGLMDIYISQEQLQFLITTNTSAYLSFYGAIMHTAENALTSGITDSALSKTIYDINYELNTRDWEGTAKTLAANILTSVLAPNLIVDVELTEKLKNEKRAEIEPVYLAAGEKIVDVDEIITEEIYYILESLGYADALISDSIELITGMVILIVLMFAVVLIYIYYFNKTIAKNKNEMLLLLTIYSLTVILCRSMNNMPYFFMPVLLFSVLASLLIEFKLSLVLTVSVTVICSLIYNGDFEFIVFFLLNGIFACILAKFILERHNVFKTSLLIAFISASTVVALHFLFNIKDIRPLADNIAYSVSAALLTVIIALGSLPFWEAVFGIVTPVRLLELTNPNKPALRRLIIEAPGTYHHSLIVANLAETAAFDIGANHILARVGSYYHDLGKLKYPLYFAENQVGENPHDDLDPYESAYIITNHVSDGLELAASYNLPEIVKSFIEQHHGNTLTKYFYHKAKNLKPGEEIDEQYFRYRHSKPSTREAAIVMLADTIEAAVRSMIPAGKSTDEVEALVKTLIKDKLDDNQLIDSGLTIKNLDEIAQSFMRVFKGMYHERIPYPKAKG